MSFYSENSKKDRDTLCLVSVIWYLFFKDKICIVCVYVIANNQS